jgi:hypothetical protein
MSYTSAIVIPDVITEKQSVDLNCLAFSVTNKGTAKIVVLGEELNTGESVSFPFIGVKYVQQLQIEFLSNTGINVIVRQAVPQENC